MPQTQYIGKRVGHLTVIALAGINKHRETTWRCRCDCGKETIVSRGRLRTGHTKSCGCLKAETDTRRTLKHGNAQGGTGASTPTYRSWLSMNQRCTNPKKKTWKHYGGRGITICERWRGENGFQNFLADMGPRPAGMTLDRWPNNNGNYEPGNCRWATPSQQNRNQRRRAT